MPTENKGTRRRIITWEDPAIIADAYRNMTGLEYLNALLKKEIPTPAVMKLVGHTLTEVENGRVVFEFVPTEVHCNPMGAVQGGLLSTILDSTMASAIRTKLAAGISYPTVELKINFLLPVTLKTGRVRCEGKVIHLGVQIATAEGRLMDQRGKLYVHGTTTCLLTRPKARRR